MTITDKLRALLSKAEAEDGPGWDNDIIGEPLLMALPELIAVLEAAEQRVAELEAALRAYQAICGAWRGREFITLSAEALRQWQSIADEALAGTRFNLQSMTREEKT